MFLAIFIFSCHKYANLMWISQEKRHLDLQIMRLTLEIKGIHHYQNQSQ
jgi:hypothetical protein